MAEAAIEKFKRIKSLKCFENVEDMLYAGFPLSAVASFIQTRMHEYRDVKRDSLIEVLKRYRRTLKSAGLVCSSLPRVFVEAEKDFTNKMKELERLEEMYRAQQYRFDVAHANERMTGALDPLVDKIERGMRDIAMSMHKIKMDLGLVGSRDLGTITVSAERIAFIKDKYGDGAAQAFADPVSRGRVLAALGAIQRAGKLRDQDGSPLELTQHMDLSEEEQAQVIDIDMDNMEDDLDEIEEQAVSEVKEKKPPTNFVPRGEDLTRPSEDMDDVTDEEGAELNAEKEEAVRDPVEQEIEMEPVRQPGVPGLPPPIRRPSVRGNSKGNWTTRAPKKEK